MSAPTDFDRIEIRATRHAGDDDLLTAGLGAAGLRLPQPPAPADPASPTPAEQRRRAIWSNWHGIADLAGAARVPAAVPGREFHALLTLPGARHPQRVMLQLPDDFDHEARCLVVTASSGSRGIYGAIAVAGAWALPRGFAVVYADKGCGCDWFDAAAGVGVALDGTPTDDPARMAFAPTLARGGSPRVAIRHAHSGDHPEADWGRHLRQAADWARGLLDRLLPPAPARRTRVIAAGLSNGGAAVLRAAADAEPWLDGAVVGAPNVHAEGGRPLYDYASEAALWLAAAGAHPMLHEAPLPTPLLDAAAWQAQRAAAVAAIARHGLLETTSPRAIASACYARLRSSGWTEAAMNAASLSTGFDMWRAACVTYSWSYARQPADRHPLGYGMAMLDGDGAPRAPTAAERADWWSLGAGIVPGAGVGLIDPAGPGGDPWPGLLKLRQLWHGDDSAALALREAVAATTAAAPRRGLPLILMHGVDDGLIPEAFSSAPYVAAARRAGRSPSYWRLHGVQHFDGFLALPQYRARYRPLLPTLHEALDALWAHLQHGAPLPGDREIGRPTAGAECLPDAEGECVARG